MLGGVVRSQVVGRGVRYDGRTPGEVRHFEAETSLFPVLHGSALASLGETQALGTTIVDAWRMIKPVEPKDLIIAGDKEHPFSVSYELPPHAIAGVYGVPSARLKPHCIDHAKFIENALSVNVGAAVRIGLRVPGVAVPGVAVS